MNKTKICKYCKSEIQEDALKCSNCREWLNKTEISFKNPYFYSVLFFAFTLGMYFVAHSFMKKTTSDFYDRIKSISYTPDKKIKLISSKLIKEKHGYRVVGEIENNESYMWDSVELVAIFKDKNDELLYLASAYVRDLNPGEKRYFQTLQPCSDDPHDLGKFKDYELRIETASANFKTK